jgi:hypothetical protein
MNSIIDQCILILQKTEVKDEIKKNIMSPLVNLILSEIYPYIYLSFLFIIISFLLHLGIFFILVKNKIYPKV